MKGTETHIGVDVLMPMYIYTTLNGIYKEEWMFFKREAIDKAFMAKPYQCIFRKVDMFKFHEIRDGGQHANDMSEEDMREGGFGYYNFGFFASISEMMEKAREFGYDGDEVKDIYITRSKDGFSVSY